MLMPVLCAAETGPLLTMKSPPCRFGARHNEEAQLLVEHSGQDCMSMSMMCSQKCSISIRTGLVEPEPHAQLRVDDAPPQLKRAGPFAAIELRLGTGCGVVCEHARATTAGTTATGTCTRPGSGRDGPGGAHDVECHAVERQRLWHRAAFLSAVV